MVIRRFWLLAPRGWSGAADRSRGGSGPATTAVPVPPVLAEIDDRPRAASTTRSSGRRLDRARCSRRRRSSPARDGGRSRTPSTTGCSRLSTIRTPSACPRAAAGAATGPRRASASAGRRRLRGEGSRFRSSAADAAGIRVGDRILAVGGVHVRARRASNFRDLFFVFEGPPGTTVGGDLAGRQAPSKKTGLVRKPRGARRHARVEERARDRGRGKPYGYLARLGHERGDRARRRRPASRPRERRRTPRRSSKDWGEIEGLSCSMTAATAADTIPTSSRRSCGGSGAPATTTRITRDGKRLVPPAYGHAAGRAPRQLRDGVGGRVPRAQVPRARDRADRRRGRRRGC